MTTHRSTVLKARRVVVTIRMAFHVSLKFYWFHENENPIATHK